MHAGAGAKSPLNSYYASTGTTTTSYGGTDAYSDQYMGVNNGVPSNCNGGQGSTGLFYYATSYGIQSVTDGTSNTIAFAEGFAATTTYRQQCTGPA